MKLRGFAAIAVLMLGATTLLTGCGDKADSSPAPAPATTKAPATPAADQTDPAQDPSEDPSTPANDDPATGDKSDFCSTLKSRAADLNSGKDISQVSHDELEKTVDALGELADKAPAEIKTQLTTIHQIYADVADGKTKTTDEAEMKKVAQATLAYVNWTVTHCAPPGS
jgi:hypothetical protein